MVALEFGAGCEEGVAASAYRAMLDSGFLIGYDVPHRVVRFFPPLTIGEEDVVRLAANLDRVLDEL